MTTDEIVGIQQRLGLSDNKMAECLCVTRQTWRNWRTGHPCPKFARNSLRWLMELRRIDPANENVPARMRVNL